MIPASRWR